MFGPTVAGPVDDAFRRPFQVLLVAFREVGWLRNVNVLAQGAAVQGDPLTLEDDLHHARCHLDFDHLVDQLVGNAVEIFVHRALHVAVHVDAGLRPFGQFIRLGRERFQSRAVDGLEENPPGAIHLLKRLVVEFGHLGHDGPVELGQGEEGVVSEGGQHPPFGILDAFFHLRLCRRLVSLWRV